MSSILNQSTVSVHGDDTSHYQHGIPGIPTDGKVVLLKNSELRSEVYLIGNDHISKQSAETVRKVINYVRPDVVAVELCAGRATDMNHNWEEVTLFDLLCRSMSAPGGLRTKFGRFAMCFSQRQMRADAQRQMGADAKLPGLGLKVAVEEASRVGARCALIDQDYKLTLEKVAKASSWKIIWNSLCTNYYQDQDTEYTRSYVQKVNILGRKHNPEFFKVLTEDRDKFMFENLRAFDKKVVAVVGLAHLDGIELLWKHAEKDAMKQPSVLSEDQG